MSMINFIKSPFPDNHDGFDYAPKSVQDIQRESAEINKTDKESKLLGMVLSILK